MESSKRVFVLNIIKTHLHNVCCLGVIGLMTPLEEHVAPNYVSLQRWMATKIQKIWPIHIRYLCNPSDVHEVRDKSNWCIVLPNKPRYKVNNEFTLPVAFQEENVSHMTQFLQLCWMKKKTLKKLMKMVQMREVKRRSRMMIVKILTTKHPPWWLWWS